MFVKLKNGEIVEVEDDVMYCSLPPQYIRKDNKQGVLKTDIAEYLKGE